MFKFGDKEQSTQYIFKIFHTEWDKTPHWQVDLAKAFMKEFNWKFTDPQKIDENAHRVAGNGNMLYNTVAKNITRAKCEFIRLVNARCKRSGGAVAIKKRSAAEMKKDFEAYGTKRKVKSRAEYVKFNGQAVNDLRCVDPGEPMVLSEFGAGVKEEDEDEKPAAETITPSESPPPQGQGNATLLAAVQQMQMCMMAMTSMVAVLAQNQSGSTVNNIPQLPVMPMMGQIPMMGQGPTNPLGMQQIETPVNQPSRPGQVRFSQKILIIACFFVCLISSLLLSTLLE